MDLYKEIIVNLLEKDKIQLSLSSPQDDITSIINSICYQTLSEIKTILADETLDDKDCFQKIEAIVCTFENIGVKCGNRHDF